MMLGARTAAWAKSGGGAPTARDYVQDGLVAMWDGVENAGWGVHDQNATTWKDLVGDFDLTVTTGAFVLSGFVGLATSATRPICANTTVTALLSFDKISTGYPVDAYDDSGGYRIYTNDATGNIRFRWFVSRGSGLVWQPAFLNQALDTPFSYTLTGDGDSGLKKVFLGGELIQTSGSQVGFANGSGGLNVGSKYCTMYNFRIYSRVLTAEEIAANYAIDKARFNLP